MALDYRKCAQEIFDNLGGKNNVISAAHCATRLRLVIADNSKLNTEVLENIEGVKGMFNSNGQLQLIIGTGTVNKVYDEFLAISGLTAASKADVKAAAASRMPLWKKILKTPGDVFVPILPAIVASGLMMGLVEAIPKFWPSFANTDWFAFLDMVANTAFALLPVLSILPLGETPDPLLDVLLPPGLSSQGQRPSLLLRPPGRPRSLSQGQPSPPLLSG